MFWSFDAWIFDMNAKSLSRKFKNESQIEEGEKIYT